MTAQKANIFQLVERGDRQAVSAMLAEGTDMNLRDRFGVGLLHRAAAGGDAEMLRLLMESGASPNATSEVGNTPLMLASANGHLAAVELLLSQGADPEMKNRWGYSAAAWADWAPAGADIKAVLQAAHA